jgi:hypothetical protein
MAMLDQFDEQALQSPHGPTYLAASKDRPTGAVGSAPSASALTTTRPGGRIDLDDPLTRLPTELTGKAPGLGGHPIDKDRQP